MLKIIFLILVIFSLTAFAQTEEKSETKESYKFFEFGKISKTLLKEKMSAFLDEVNKNDSMAYIINYGKPKEIAKRERDIQENIRFREFHDGPRITIVNGGDNGELKTVFWIVPPGAEPPTP